MENNDKIDDKPTSNVDDHDGVFHENTFVIADAISGEKSPTRELKQRKAVVLAKANARHVIKSWQKRHIFDNDVKRMKASRPYIQHISEAVQNDNGEKIYFRWEEAGKVMNPRQPKAVGKLYSYRRKRLAKKKTNRKSPESKSAPNRGGSDHSSGNSSNNSRDNRSKTATTNSIVANEHDDKSKDEIISIVARPNGSRKLKRVEFDLTSSRYREVKEAFLSNSAKNIKRNSTHRKNSAVNNNSIVKINSTPGKSKEQSNFHPIEPTNSDKENAFVPQKDHEAGIIISKNSLKDVKSENKNLEPKQQRKTYNSENSRNVLTESDPKRKRHSSTSSDKSVSFLEPKPPEASKSSITSEREANFDHFKRGNGDSNDDSNYGHKRKESEGNDQENTRKTHQVEDASLKSNEKKAGSNGDSSSARVTSNEESDIGIVNKKNTSMSSFVSPQPISSTADTRKDKKEDVINQQANGSHRKIALDETKDKANLLESNEKSQTKIHLNNQAPSSELTKCSVNKGTKVDIVSSKKQLYRNKEPKSFQKPISILDNGASSLNSSLSEANSDFPHSDTGSNRVGIVEGRYLKRIDEAPVESSVVLYGDQHNNNKINDKLPHRKHADIDARITGKGRTMSTQNRDSSIHQKVTTRMNTKDKEVVDSRLSVSWPKTNMNTKKNEKRKNYSKPIKKSTSSHRLDLVGVGNSSEDDSPPLSIYRYIGDDNTDRKHTQSLDSVSQNSVLLKSERVDRTEDKDTGLTEGRKAIQPFNMADPNGDCFQSRYNKNGDEPGDKIIDSDGALMIDIRNRSNEAKDKMDEGLMASNNGFRKQQFNLITDHVTNESGLKTDPRKIKEIGENQKRNNLSDISVVEDTSIGTENSVKGTQGTQILQTNGKQDVVIAKHLNDKILQENSMLTSFTLKSNGTLEFTYAHKGNANVNFEPSQANKTNGHIQAIQNSNMNGVEANLLSASISERPASAGMSRFLDRSTFWNDDYGDANDDDIKFINDEKDYYEVFGYDAETEAILNSTRIFPVSDFQDTEVNNTNNKETNPKTKGNKAGELNSYSEINKKPKDFNFGFGHRKVRPRRLVRGNSTNMVLQNGKFSLRDDNSFVKTNKPFAGQEEERVKAHDRLVSLTLLSESGNSLHKSTPMMKDHSRLIAKKGSHNENVIISTSSSSPASSQSSQSPTHGYPRSRKGDNIQLKGFSHNATIPEAAVIKENGYSRRFRRMKSLESVNKDSSVFPVNDMHHGKTPKPPTIVYQNETTVFENENKLKGLNAIPSQQSRTIYHNTNTIKNIGPQKKNKVSDQASANEQNSDLSPALNAFVANEHKLSPALHGKASLVASREPAVQPSLRSNIEHYAVPARHQSIYEKSEHHGQRGPTDVAQQNKKPSERVLNEYLAVTTNTTSKVVHPPIRAYNEATTRIRHRILDQNNGQKPNSDMNGSYTKINHNSLPFSNTSNKHVGSSRIQGLPPGRDAGEASINTFVNIPIRDNEERQSAIAPSQISDTASLSKPRKLKPIIHHPGIQKRHQHLTSGL